MDSARHRGPHCGVRLFSHSVLRYSVRGSQAAHAGGHLRRPYLEPVSVHSLTRTYGGPDAAIIRVFANAFAACRHRIRHWRGGNISRGSQARLPVRNGDDAAVLPGGPNRNGDLRSLLLIAAAGGGNIAVTPGQIDRRQALLCVLVGVLLYEPHGAAAQRTGVEPVLRSGCAG